MGKSFNLDLGGRLVADLFKSCEKRIDQAEGFESGSRAIRCAGLVCCRHCELNVEEDFGKEKLLRLLWESPIIHFNPEPRTPHTLPLAAPSRSHMSEQNVLVTYAAPQPFLFSENWRQIQSALRSQLPLRNIHWKPPSRQSLRTIQELDVELIPLDSVRGENTSQIPVTLLEKPLLNIYIITCEVNIPGHGLKTA